MPPDWLSLCRLPLCSLSRLYQAGNLISLAVGDNGNIHNSIKLSNDHRQQLGVNIIDPINRHILLASEQNMCQAATPTSNGKYSNCTFLQSFVRSSEPSNGRCWLTIELFCQYIVKRLQICSNIKGSTLHTSLLTRLISFSWITYNYQKHSYSAVSTLLPKSKLRKVPFLRSNH